MINEPRFDDTDPIQCGGCPEPAHCTAIVDGEVTPLCADCLHESTFICPDCPSLEARHWSCYGRRLYVSPALYCASCFKSKDDAAHASWAARQDEYRDDFQQERR